jgi:hypothetical protein
MLRNWQRIVLLLVMGILFFAFITRMTNSAPTTVASQSTSSLSSGDTSQCKNEENASCQNTFPHSQIVPFSFTVPGHPLQLMKAADQQSDMQALISSVLVFDSCTQQNNTNPNCGITSNGLVIKLFNASRSIALVGLVLIIILLGFQILIGPIFETGRGSMNEHIVALLIVVGAIVTCDWLMSNLLNLNTALINGFANLLGISDMKTAMSQFLSPNFDDYQNWLNDVIYQQRNNVLYSFNIRDFFLYLNGIITLVDFFIVANFIMRLIYIAVLYVTAPIAILCYFLPSTRRWTTFWMRLLSFNILFQSVQLIFLMVGQSISNQSLLWKNYPAAPTFILSATILLTLRVPGMLRSVFSLAESPLWFDDEYTQEYLNSLPEIDTAGALGMTADVLNYASDIVDDIDTGLTLINAGIKYGPSITGGINKLISRMTPGSGNSGTSSTGGGSEEGQALEGENVDPARDVRNVAGEGEQEGDSRVMAERGGPSGDAAAGDAAAGGDAGGGAAAGGEAGGGAAAGGEAAGGAAAGGEAAGGAAAGEAAGDAAGAAAGAAGGEAAAEGGILAAGAAAAGETLGIAMVVAAIVAAIVAIVAAITGNDQQKKMKEMENRLQLSDTMHSEGGSGTA